ncbi:MAG TPA: Fic family protein [Candidatus Dojkabacteria bacterium]|nr:Fic family protein [Candidatus Dojkabacteria bacterium]HQF36321.1 Fic family protein [Candidatus Dojkabacteria bacterium]
MYSPNYYITNKILHHIVQFELAYKDIQNLPLPIKEKRDFYSSVKNENLYHIAKLIGVDISMKDAEKIFTGKEINVLEKPKVLLINYRNALEFISQMSKDKYLNLAPGTLLHLNKILTSNWTDSWNSGRFRSKEEKYNDEYDRWSHIRNGKSLKDFNQQYITEVLDWVKETRFQVHPLIKIAVAVYEIFSCYPFFTGNQLTILGLTEMLYSEFGIWEKSLLPINRHFYTNEEQYIKALTACIESCDITMWIELFVKGVDNDTQQVREQIFRIEQEKVQQKKKLFLGLNSRQLQAINYLKKYSQITRKKYTEIMGISFMSSYRDLNELVKRKLIFQYGHGRSTFYTLTPKENTEKNNEDIFQTKYKNVGKVGDDSNKYMSPFESENNESFVTQLEKY